MFMNDHYATMSGALIASMIIIPLQTVIPEELAFRGVLHGALNRAWGFRGVAAAGSLLFGLWHIATSLGLTSSNVGFTRIFGGGVFGMVAGVVMAVIATGAAGFVFTWLRRRSGSLIAPIALHWSLNGLGALAAALVWHLSTRSLGAAFAGAELAVLELVAARRHLAPGAAVVAGAVVERPLALVVRARLEVGSQVPSRWASLMISSSSMSRAATESPVADSSTSPWSSRSARAVPTVATSRSGANASAVGGGPPALWTSMARRPSRTPRTRLRSVGRSSASAVSKPLDTSQPRASLGSTSRSCPSGISMVLTSAWMRLSGSGAGLDSASASQCTERVDMLRV